jgi:DNA-binding transcriptional MerR regulator
MDSMECHISQAAQQLRVTPKHLRLLERQGRIPPARRDFNGRVYSVFDIALLKALGVGSRPRRLKSAEEIVGQSR